MNTIRSFFWVLALGVILLYAFLLALGAFAVDEVAPVSIAVAVLVVLWGVHAVLERRHQHDLDRMLSTRGARERRGF